MPRPDTERELERKLAGRDLDAAVRRLRALDLHCFVCGDRLFKNCQTPGLLQDLRTHLVECHYLDRLNKTMVARYNAAGKLQCAFCPKTYKYPSAWAKHAGVKHWSKHMPELLPPQIADVMLELEGKREEIYTAYRKWVHEEIQRIEEQNQRKALLEPVIQPAAGSDVTVIKSPPDQSFERDVEKEKRPGTVVEGPVERGRQGPESVPMETTTVPEEQEQRKPESSTKKKPDWDMKERLERREQMRKKIPLYGVESRLKPRSGVKYSESKSNSAMGASATPAAERPPTVQEVCDNFWVNDVDLDYTEADYQNLTTYKRFLSNYKARIEAANPKIPQPKIMMLVAAKWREFDSQNPSAATTEASTPAAAHDEDDEDETPRKGNARSSRAGVKKVVEKEIPLVENRLKPRSEVKNSESTSTNSRSAMAASNAAKPTEDEQSGEPMETVVIASDDEDMSAMTPAESNSILDSDDTFAIPSDEEGKVTDATPKPVAPNESDSVKLTEDKSEETSSEFEAESESDENTESEAETESDENTDFDPSRASSNTVPVKPKAYKRRGISRRRVSSSEESNSCDSFPAASKRKRLVSESEAETVDSPPASQRDTPPFEEASDDTERQDNDVIEKSGSNGGNEPDSSAHIAVGHADASERQRKPLQEEANQSKAKKRELVADRNTTFEQSKKHKRASTEETGSLSEQLQKVARLYMSDAELLVESESTNTEEAAIDVSGQESVAVEESAVENGDGTGVIDTSDREREPVKQEIRQLEADIVGVVGIATARAIERFEQLEKEKLEETRKLNAQLEIGKQAAAVETRNLKEQLEREKQEANKLKEQLRMKDERILELKRKETAAQELASRIGAAKELLRMECEARKSAESKLETETARRLQAASSLVSEKDAHQCTKKALEEERAGRQQDQRQLTIERATRQQAEKDLEAVRAALQQAADYMEVERATRQQDRRQLAIERAARQQAEQDLEVERAARQQAEQAVRASRQKSDKNLAIYSAFREREEKKKDAEHDAERAAWQRAKQELVAEHEEELRAERASRQQDVDDLKAEREARQSAERTLANERAARQQAEQGLATAYSTFRQSVRDKDAERDAERAVCQRTKEELVAAHGELGAERASRQQAEEDLEAVRAARQQAVDDLVAERASRQQAEEGLARSRGQVIATKTEQLKKKPTVLMCVECHEKLKENFRNNRSPSRSPSRSPTRRESTSTLSPRATATATSTVRARATVKSILPVLSKQDKDTIQSICKAKKGGDQDEIYSEDDHVITRQNFRSLRDVGACLSESVADAYMNLLAKSSQGRVYAFRVADTRALMCPAEINGITATLCPDEDIFQFAYLLFPYRHGMDKWRMIVVDLENSAIFQFDPSPVDPEEEKDMTVLEAVSTFVKTDYFVRNGRGIERALALTDVEDCPKVEDSESGIMAVMCAKYYAVSRQHPIFKEKDIALLRKVMMIELCTRKLKDLRNPAKSNKRTVDKKKVYSKAE